MEELEKNQLFISASQAELVNRIPTLDNIDESIRERITHQKQAVLNLISQEEFYPFIDANVVSEIYDNAYSCVDFFLKGDIGSSVDVLYRLFFTGNNYLTYRRKNEGTIIGYRIRNTEHIRDLFSKEEMFHIPFDKRYKVSNQRFSISGYPCLYFSSSIKFCWRETHPKTENHFNAIALSNTKLITLIDLRQRWIAAGTISNIDFYCLLVSWLCSFAERHPDGAFKESYIIPQMMTAALVKSIRGGWRDNGISQAMHPRGFIFTSSHINDNGRRGSKGRSFDNYVIPVETDAESGLCSALEGFFKYTEPISKYREARNLKRFLEANDASTIDMEGTRELVFQFMEDTLKTNLSKH